MRVVILATVLAVALSVDAKNSVGTRNNVCVNQEDGTFVADSNLCSSFFVCHNEQPISQNCDPGSYFDTKQLYCVPDTKNICNPTECDEDGAYSVHPTNCSLFNVCNAGKLVEQSCGKDSYFDSKDLFCKPDVDHTCWPPITTPEPYTCVGKYTEGELVKDPDSCHSYYICHNGELVKQTCGYGNYFSSSTNRCERDNTGDCWGQAHAPCTGGLAEGDWVSKNCSVYLECTQGELVEHNCGYPYVFDNSTKQCVEDVNNACWEVCPPCSDGSKQGDLVGSAYNCSSYFRCDKGVLIPADCGLGNYFDNSTKNCVRDTNGVCCPPCPDGYKEGEFVPSKDNCYSFDVCINGQLVTQSCGTGNYFNKDKLQCDRDYDGICWKWKCTEGEKVPDETNCGYVVCENGKLKPKKCQEGYYFESKSNECLPDVKGICWPCPRGLKEGEKVSGYNCSVYWQCSLGKLVEINCKYQELFDNSTKQCVKDVDNKCWEKICPLCPGGYEQGRLVGSPANCSAYFVCNEGELIPADCGHGNYFDHKAGNCVRDTENLCWDKICPPCRDGVNQGDLVVDPRGNCSSFLICDQGELIPSDCGYGNYFDQKAGNCVRDTENLCWDKICPPCRDGVNQGDLVVDPSGNCSSFLICDQGKLIPSDCGYGNYFDQKAGNCVRDTENLCWDKICPPCSDGVNQGDLVPDPSGNCSSFLICDQGKLIPSDCGYGNYFDQKAGNCVRDTENLCWDKICPPCRDGVNQGDLVVDPSGNCSSFLICDQGKLIPSDCGYGNYFDQKAGNCVRDTENLCWDKICLPCSDGSNQGDLVVDPSGNCSSFLICDQGKLIPSDCGYGNYFDQKAGNCVRDTENLCWPSCNEGEKVPDETTNCGYLECKKGKYKPTKCQEGYYFESKSKKCMPDVEGICWSCTKGERVPGSNCSVYLECILGKLVEINCKYQELFNSSTQQCVKDDDNKCWDKICPPCRDGVNQGDLVVDPSGNCSSFLICDQGKLIPSDCGYGNYFDQKAGNCVRDTENLCWPSCNEGEKVPDETTNCGYLECKKGKYKPTKCQEGYYFESKSKKCMPDVEGICWSCTKGERVPGSNCSVYLECILGKLVEINCKYQELFNSSTQQCVKDDDNKCWDKICPPCRDGVNQGDLVVDPSGNCSSFLICDQGKLIPSDCGYGNYFDQKAGNCVRDTENLCWPSCNEGEKVPDETTNCGYLECKKGKYKPTKCQEGYYFESKSKKCMPDVEGICWSCTKGERVPGSNCSVYLECILGKLVEINCKYQELFNSSTQQCVKDDDNKCWDKICPPCRDGVNQGDLVVDPSGNCSSFLICDQGKLIPSDCGYGNYFDQKAGNCVRDTENLCWPSCNEGEKVPDETTNCGYLECKKGKYKPTKCQEGYYFESKSKKCMPDVEGICWSCTKGERVPGSNCSVYLECILGKLVEINCKYQELFNSSTQQCVKDDDNKCWDKICPPCRDGVNQGDLVVDPSGNCSSFLICDQGKLIPSDCGYGNYFDQKAGNCVRDTENLCWPSCNEGKKVPDETTNCGYLECKKGKYKPTKCQEGYYFESKSKKCMPDVEGICWSCTKGERVPGSNCSVYLECILGKLVEINCKYQELFNSSTQQCVKDDDNKCWDKICPPCRDGVNQGDLVVDPSGNCSSFLICDQGKLIPSDCGYGNYFDQKAGNCVRDTENLCWPSCNEGEKVPDETTNCGYLECKKGKYKPTKCQEGYYFESKSKKCMPDVEGICWSCTKGERVPGSNCSVYLECILGKLVEINCKYQELFDNSTQQCVKDDDNKCWDKICPPCRDGVNQGDLVLDPSGNCSSFLICDQGKLIPSDCGYGNYFAQKAGNCVRDTENLCWPCTEGEKIPDETTNCGYLECKKGKYKPTKCQEGYYFESKSNKCLPDVDNKCWDKICPPCPGGYEQGDLVGPGFNCSSYFRCDKGELIPDDCGVGNYFDGHNCVRDTSETCWKNDKPCVCSGGYEDGQFVPHPDECYLFYICYNGELIKHSCGYGNYFDAPSQSCILDTTGKCWSSSSSSSSTQSTTSSSTTSTTKTSSTTTPTTTTTTSSTTKSTKPTTKTTSSTTPKTTTSTTSTSTTTESCECPGGYKDGQLVPHPSDCAKFYICYNGELQEENCGRGNYFDASTESCVLDRDGICHSSSSSSSSSSSTKSTKPTTTSSSTTSTTTTTPTTTSSTTKSTKPTTTSSSTTSTTKTTTSTTPRATTSTTKSTPTTTASTTTESCECSGGYKDGDLLSHPSDCSKFYICFNGEMKEENCGRGNYFDDSTKSCVFDRDGICHSSSSSSSSSSSTKSSTSSSTKSTTTTTSSTTPKTTTSTTKSTPTTTSSTTTESCECTGGYKDGQLVPHPSDCSKFYICFNGEMKEENCGRGNYFDDSTKSCVFDRDGICHSSSSSSSSSSSTKSSTSSSTKSTTTTTSSTTPKTTTSTTKSTPTTTSSTTTESCECTGGYKDGQLVPHPSDCAKFYICYNGKLQEENCGRGNYFDASTESCVLDKDGICHSSSSSSSSSSSTKSSTSSSTTSTSTTTSSTTPKTTTSTTKSTPTTTPSTTTPETTTSSTTSSTTTPTESCDCPDGSKDGEFIPHPTDCSKFRICHQGNLTEISCGKGNYFNSTTKSCTLDTEGICGSKPEPCVCPNHLKEGQFMADPESCYKYFICLSGVLVPGNCGTNNYFNNVSKSCQPDTTHECWDKPTEPCVCPNGMQEGERVDNPDSCYKYFTCTQGNLTDGNCGTGNYFNNDTKTCERDTNNCCWPCTNGEMIADIEECDKFSICNDGKFVEQQCGTGYYFDIYQNYCVRDVNGTCWKVQPPSNTCQGAKDGTRLPDPAACEKYFVCENNKPISHECGMGNLFNTTTLSCVHDTCGECWTKIPNACANQPTGTFLPDADHCDQFLVCNENHAILQQCGSGNWFNPKSKLCEQDLYAECINICQNTEGTVQLPHPNCNQFYLCTNGLTKAVRTCPKGTNYDALLGICLASATCEENLCSTSPNGVSFPVRNDPSSFYSCYNKKPVKLSCPGGTSFDSERLICMPDAGLCIGQKNGFTTASQKNPNAYYVCKDSAAIFEQCPAHTVFDESKRICVHALRKRVVNNICSTETDGTMLSTNVCNKFHLCLDGESVEQNCGAYASFNPKLGSCVFNATCFNPKEMCGKSSDIEKFADSRDETSYITCKRGLATMEKCPKNTIYSQDIGGCVSKQMTIQKKELTEMCREVPDKTIHPALDCRKFYICNNRVAILQQCAIDQLFNMTTGTCQADTKRQCWMRSETLRKSNFLRMIDDSDDYKIVRKTF